MGTYTSRVVMHEQNQTHYIEIYFRLRPQERHQSTQVTSDHGEDLCALHDGVKLFCVLLGHFGGVGLVQAGRCLSREEVLHRDEKTGEM
jgi:hypothetical protein